MKNIPVKAQFESMGGMFYREQAGVLYFYHPGKDAWIVSKENPYLRPLQGKASHRVPPEEMSLYAFHLQNALSEKMLEIELRAGNGEISATAIAARKFDDLIEKIVDSILDESDV